MLQFNRMKNESNKMLQFNKMKNVIKRKMLKSEIII